MEAITLIAPRSPVADPRLTPGSPMRADFCDKSVVPALQASHSVAFAYPRLRAGLPWCRRFAPDAHAPSAEGATRFTPERQSFFESRRQRRRLAGAVKKPRNLQYGPMLTPRHADGHPDGWGTRSARPGEFDLKRTLHEVIPAGEPGCRCPAAARRPCAAGPPFRGGPFPAGYSARRFWHRLRTMRRRQAAAGATGAAVLQRLPSRATPPPPCNASAGSAAAALIASRFVGAKPMSRTIAV